MPYSDPDMKREADAAWRAANSRKMMGYRVSWKKRNLDKVAAQRRRKGLRSYGLTVEQYDRLLENQSHCCAICGTTDPGSRVNHFQVDHDHVIVRGLLCVNCNRGLGLLGDTLETY